MGAKTSARSTIPSSIGIGWCHVIFMPSRISVRAVTSGNSLMRFSSSKSTSYHGRGTSAMTLRPHAVHTYHEDEEEPTLSLGRPLVLAAPWILVAVAAYFSIHDCAVARGGRSHHGHHVSRESEAAAAREVRDALRREFLLRRHRHPAQSATRPAAGTHRGGCKHGARPRRE